MGRLLHLHMSWSTPRRLQLYFHAAPALEVKYLAPVPLAYAAPVAAETVGFSSFPVEPDDLDAKIKFLVAETLSGVGSFVLTHRNRFVDELGRQDYVTGEMWKNKSPFEDRIFQ